MVVMVTNPRFSMMPTYDKKEISRKYLVTQNESRTLTDSLAYPTHSLLVGETRGCDGVSHSKAGTRQKSIKLKH